MDRQVKELEEQIQLWHRENEASRKLAEIPGLGPITASAIVATVGDAREFKNGRQLAAWMGLVPKQNSSGGKQNLLGISKRGDTYLRTLLIHGARSVIRCCREESGAGKLAEKVDGQAQHRTWRRSRWRTRMPGSCGRCWPTSEHSAPITPRQPKLPACNRARSSKTIINELKESTTTDCTGNHEMMARQVRP